MPASERRLRLMEDGEGSKVDFGAAFAKGLTFRMGQTHTHRYLRPLLERVERGDIDPSFVITHSMNLADAPDGYRIFRRRKTSA